MKKLINHKTLTVKVQHLSVYSFMVGDSVFLIVFVYVCVCNHLQVEVKGR